MLQGSKTSAVRTCMSWDSASSRDKVVCTRQPSDTMVKMTAARPNFILLAIGGNDISVISKPEDLFAVKVFKEAGVQEVFVSEMLPMADFSGVDESLFRPTEDGNQQPSTRKNMVIVSSSL